MVRTHRGVPSVVVRSTTDPRLRPLAFIGGPTQTFALAADSPAVNAGGNAAAAGSAPGAPADGRRRPKVRALPEVARLR